MQIQIAEKRYSMQFNDIERYALLRRLQGAQISDDRDGKIIREIIRMLGDSADTPERPAA